VKIYTVGNRTLLFLRLIGMIGREGVTNNETSKFLELSGMTILHPTETQQVDRRRLSFVIMPCRNINDRIRSTAANRLTGKELGTETVFGVFLHSILTESLLLRLMKRVRMIYTKGK